MYTYIPYKQDKNYIIHCNVHCLEIEFQHTNSEKILLKNMFENIKLLPALIAYKICPITYICSLGKIFKNAFLYVSG